MSICPLCNGLCTVDKSCAGCGRALLDMGVLQDFYDNYSAYLDRGVYKDGFPCHTGERCFHLFTCSYCHADKILSIKQLGENEVLDTTRVMSIPEG